MPWPQRWELVRERLLPLACFAATVVACASLWPYWAGVAPPAVGEVRYSSVVVHSPCDGELLPVDDDGPSSWPLFADVESGALLARVKSNDEAGQIVELAAPLDGRITATAALAGQHVAKGDPLLTIASSRPDYIMCHVPDRGQQRPRSGANVAVRRRQPGAQWTPAKVEAVGPALEPAPAYQGGTAAAAERGLPIRIALPAGLELAPGSLVDVRFPAEAPRASSH